MEINSVNTNINFEHIKKTTDESKKACLSENRTDLASLNNYKHHLNELFRSSYIILVSTLS